MYRISSKSRRLQNVATYFRQLATIMPPLKILPHGKGLTIIGLDWIQEKLNWVLQWNAHEYH